jgi:hypothetical protein
LEIDLLMLTASVRVVQILENQSATIEAEVEEEVPDPVVELIIEPAPSESNGSAST